MLGKLIKYDLQNLFKQCLPLYLVGIALTLINGTIMIPLLLNDGIYIQDSLFYHIFLATVPTISVIFVATLGLMAAFLVCKNFMNTVFGKEGYLTNTLPVTEHQIIQSKIISSTLVLIVTAIVSAACGIGYLFMMNAAEIPEIDWSQIELSIIPHMLSIGLVTLVSTLTIVFACIALGHLSKHKIAASVLWYFVINNFIINPLHWAATCIIPAIDDNRVKDVVDEVSSIYNDFLIMSWKVTGITALIAIVCYFVIIKIMKKRLNLV